MPENEIGWLPDCIYRNGTFEEGVAMVVGSDGRIARFSRAPEDLRLARRLPRRAVLPGLVDAHSHSFQRAIRGRTEHRTSASGDSFWTWRDAMYIAAGRLTPDDIYDVARMTFLEALKSGITTIGEFHYLHHAVGGARYDDPNLLGLQNVRAAADTGVRIALLRTAYARSGWKKEPNPDQARFITPSAAQFIEDTEALRASLANTFASGAVWVGVAPHSIRALPLEYLLDLSTYARTKQLPLHMHVSEQPAEIEACQAEHGARPIELLDRYGILDPRFTGIHATHVTQAEIDCLARARAHVCACPTTERNLGDGIGPADRWMQAGVGICLGSDSNVQIDLLEDARELEYHLRLQRLERAVLTADESMDGLAGVLLENATRAGAASLGSPEAYWEPGSPADFLTIDLNDVSIAGAGSDSLLANIVFSVQRTAIRGVYVNGLPMIEEGHHAREEEIVDRFGAVQRRLWGTVS